jgi:hypothetical protein
LPIVFRSMPNFSKSEFPSVAIDPLLEIEAA